MSDEDRVFYWGLYVREFLNDLAMSMTGEGCGLLLSFKYKKKPEQHRFEDYSLIEEAVRCSGVYIQMERTISAKIKDRKSFDHAKA